jgi:hypothetical protein
MDSLAGRDIRRTGNANVRVRAVESLRILEWAELMASDSLKRVRQVGRHLYLAYEAKEDRFRWRKLGRRGHIQEVLGARLPRAWWDRLYRSTRERVANVECMLETRAGIRRALHLAVWMAEHWTDIADETLQLLWQMPTVVNDMAGQTWTLSKTGGLSVTKTYHVRPDAPAYGCTYLPSLTQAARWEVAKREQAPGAGPAVGAAERVVAALEGRHATLLEWRKGQTAALRVYYDEGKDQWRWRSLRGRAGGSVTMSFDAMMASVAALGDRDPQVSAKWDDYVLWRRSRRVLLLLALLGEGAIQFPGGGWILRGRGAGSQEWTWVVDATRRSVFARHTESRAGWGVTR